MAFFVFEPAINPINQLDQMKTLHATFFFFCLSILFSCDSSSFKGTYQCADCLYTQLDFKEDGTVEIHAGGIKAKGDFAQADQKITITTETAEYVFNIKDANTIEGVGDVSGTYVMKQ